jgi:hypothetical protein
MLDLFLNRECQDCVYGEFDILRNTFWCTLREAYRDAAQRDPCPDVRTRREDGDDE